MRSLFCFVWLIAVASQAAAQEPATAAIVGGRTTYVVQAGDTLTSISARFAVSRAALIALNELTKPDRLSPGQTLVLDNTHLANVDPDVTLTINIPQRMLFVTENQQVRGFPVTVGRKSWQTPIGRFTIQSKENDPVWEVPVSIQKEMAQLGRPVITRMEPSPINPLGAHWMGLSMSGIGIHGTNAPSSIYAFASHGCIRMHPEDAAALFDRVSVGTTGVLVYQPVLLAMIDGKVWLEVHPDVYQLAPDAARYVRAVIVHFGLAAGVNWELIDQTVRQQQGRAVDVTADPR